MAVCLDMYRKSLQCTLRCMYVGFGIFLAFLEEGEGDLAY